MLFSTLKKKFGGGGGVTFFFRKTIISHFTFYDIFNITKNNIEKCPFTYWLNGRWFLQIVDRDSILCYLQHFLLVKWVSPNRRYICREF